MRKRGIVLAVFAAVSIFTAGAAYGDDPAPQPKRVGQFNDGFRDAKQDDCEQGFQPACSWLVEVR